MNHKQMLALTVVGHEFEHAESKFPPFASAHEGYAIIKEEVDELWDEIKNNKTSTEYERCKEAMQVAAMALRYIVDLHDENTLQRLYDEHQAKTARL